MLWFWTGRLYKYSVGLLHLELGPQLWYSDALYSSQEPFSLEDKRNFESQLTLLEVMGRAEEDPCVRKWNPVHAY